MSSKNRKEFIFGGYGEKIDKFEGITMPSFHEFRILDENYDVIWTILNYTVLKIPFART